MGFVMISSFRDEAINNLPEMTRLLKNKKALKEISSTRYY